MMIRHTLIALAIGAALHACGVAPERSPLPPPPAQEMPRQAEPAAAPVVALIDKAQTARDAGRFEDAAASLERAVRIDPYNPVAWQMLARVRLAQGDGNQAEAMATKSSSLAYDNDELQRENWRIIGQARRMRGDQQGARAAERQADGI